MDEKDGFLLDRGFQVDSGLTLAGEYTEDSSINGFMLSREKATKEVMCA